MMAKHKATKLENRGIFMNQKFMRVRKVIVMKKDQPIAELLKDIPVKPCQYDVN